MSKYFKLTLLSIIAFFLAYTLSSFETANAVVNPSEHEAYLNSIVTKENYNEIINDIIKDSFPEFDIQPDEFNDIVTNNKYKILEITPTTYTDENSEISEIDDSLNSIKEIYHNIIDENEISSPHFITNMPNFELETMTTKHFVATRSDLLGKYDAIIFVPGHYQSPSTNACDINDDNLHMSILYKNNVLRYVGTTLNKTNNFDEAIFHGIGTLFYDNGDLEYVGTWNEGKRSCFGISYDKNGILRYMGEWLNDLYHGYGISFDKNGRFEYMGLFKNGKPSSGGNEIPEEFMNDITLLKANQIIAELIEEGMPVFISQEALNDSESIMYQSFYNLLQNENVFSIKPGALNNNNFYTTLAIMKVIQLYSNKPILEFHNTLKDYYEKNDLVNFEFSLTNMDEASLEFYFDVNQNEIFEEFELIYNYNIRRGKNEFSFYLPDLYSNIVKYKILVKNDGKTSLYDGYINVKGDIEEIKVLNLVANNYVNIFDNQLFKQYFEENGKYNISIKTCTAQEFKKNNNKWDCSHQIVMDNYDVIIFGQGIFNDSLNEVALRSIEAQIENGKPFIFTSSVTRGHKKWLNYFGEEIGFSDKYNEIYKLNNKNDKLEIINQNSFVLYPFDMNNENLEVPNGINYTLNESNQMDLENPNLIPLMNMYNTSNSMYDRYDSYNNYYFTKNENIVYLNIGYNPYEKYKESELKLLVNAIVNLFVEKNAANQRAQDMFFIESNNDYEEKLVDVNDTIKFTFKVNSIIDEQYNYTLLINNDKILENEIQSNQNIDVEISVKDYLEIDNSIKNLEIKIEVEKNGLKQIYEFTIYITDMSSYKVIEPKFTDYIFIPYGEIVDIRDYFLYNSDTISELEFYLLGSLLEIDGYMLKANEVGREKVEVVACDIFGNEKRYTFDVLSYVPIESLTLEDITISQGQEDYIKLNIDAKNILFEYLSGDKNIVKIKRDGNNFIINGLYIGEAKYRFYGYDINGNIVEDVVTITVVDAADILFKKTEISIFIFNQFTIDDLRELIIINNPDYSILDVEFTSLHSEIISINGEEVIVHGVGEAIIQASIKDGEEYCSLLVRVFDKVQSAGFKPGLDIIKIYVGIKQYLDNYLYTYPENMPLDSLVINFEIVEDSEKIIVDFNGNSFNTIKPGYITLRVTIMQYNDKGEEVLDSPIIDIITLRIHEEPDPGGEDVS